MSSSSTDNNMLNISAAKKNFSVSFFWLRDHCRCERCYDFSTHQRIFNFLDIPINIKPTEHSIDDGNNLNVIWSDGHKSLYSIDELHGQQYETYSKVEHRPLTLWSADEIKTQHPYARVQLADYLADDSVAKSVMASIVRYGLAFVEGATPTKAGTEQAVTRLFAVHKTFFGEMWSFSDDKDHSDSAYSKAYLGAHTDNTYFNDAAGIQVLHCTEHNGTGGESLLLDGFKAAADLRCKYPESYARLTTVPIPAEYIEPGQHHVFDGPAIRLNQVTGQPEQIRFNLYDRSYMVSLPQSKMQQFYEDLRLLTIEIQSKANEWWFKLVPGTVVLFDNWRLLHGRAAYEGRRYMSGCYVSRTEYQSVARKMGIIS